ncbi:ATP-binding protein [Planktotalea sp.]|uniref:ATP-binding protein n=1 Tax=Planktotalea sp. TaxID=2029877 RepID=UPI003D6C2E55
MKLSKANRRRAQMVFPVALGVIGFIAIAILYFNISSDLRRLSSASSDNVQWTLSQTEVEFLEFAVRLDNAKQEAEPDLAGLRRSFDIFYSRINTLNEASIFGSVRELEQFSNNLAALKAFLKQAVVTIDADDETMKLALTSLSKTTKGVRSNVRKLSNSGLNFFATESDNRRNQISFTLSQMAVGVTVLLLALLLFAFYLFRLNQLNIRRRKEAIQASSRMNIVTSTALDAVIVCDTYGKILDFNAAAEQIFGFSASDAINQDLGALIVPDKHRAAHDAGMKRMRDSGEKRVVGKGRIQLEAKHANGTLFPMEFAIQSAQTQEGEIFVSFLRDISRRVQAEQELVEARDRALAGEKSKTDFLATMSHEIRTPLNGLLGNLTLLSDTDLSAKQSRYIMNMETSGKLLMSHISDVLDITKYDAGKLQLRPVTMNISALLQDIVDNQSGAATANDTNLDWHWSGDITEWIFADEERIQHVLMNVIGNAVKFTRNGQVTVTAQVSEDDDKGLQLHVSIEDTGVGMSEELKAQIFDDFMTGDASYDRDVGGTGLGLGIAKRFVTAMGGSIEVESEEGVGSTFDVRFPIEPTSAPKKPTERAKPLSATRGGHVLLVEDNEINRIVAREMLAAAGHQVSEAHNGKIALEMIEDQAFDLILMDISMPIMDGRTATRAIRASKGASAKTPIVALTANAMAEEQKAFLSDGMNDILTKPLSRESLLDVLSQYIGEAPSGEGQASVMQDLVEKQHLQELLDTLGAEALQPLLDRFDQEVGETIELLQACDKHPLEDVAKHAHKIAGSAAALGAIELRAVLVNIENAAKQGDLASVKDVASGLPEVWKQTRLLMRV